MSDRNGLPVIIDRDARKLPRLRARRTASTFHRRKVDRKAAGGPLHQGRNAPRSPPFALSEDGFCCTPAPRLPRGFALPLRGDGRRGTRAASPAGGGRAARRASARPPASAGVRFSASHLPEIYGILGGPRKTCFAGHSSTFHRRKVDRKAAGGPLHQGRNAPRSPPFARFEKVFFCTPAPRLPRGFALLLWGDGRRRTRAAGPAGAKFQKTGA